MMPQTSSQDAFDEPGAAGDVRLDQAAKGADAGPGTTASDQHANASLDILNAYPLETRPTCPTVLIPYDGRLYSLPVQRLDIRVEVALGTAFVRISGTWRNVASYASDAMFTLPTRGGIVTGVEMEIDNRHFGALVLPRDEAERMAAQGSAKAGAAARRRGSGSVAGGAGGAGAAAAPAAGGDAAGAGDEEADANDGFGAYVPGLFRLPVPQVQSGDEVTITVKYLEQLTFVSGGQYRLLLPLRFSSSLIPEGMTMRDVLSISCTINSTNARTKYECRSHELRLVRSEYPRIELQAVNIGELPRGADMRAALEAERAGSPLYCTDTHSVDFELLYSLASDDILATLIKEERKDDNSDGTFCLFVTPPSLGNAGKFFRRDMVFLLDRSGSMTGEPFLEATRALVAALGSLNEDDRFTIVSFDHRQEVFSSRLVPATRANTDAAARWVRSHQPERGGTDIFTPLEWSLQLLEGGGGGGVGAAGGGAGAASARGGGGGGGAGAAGGRHGETRVLPFVVLLTDGCVENERQICQHVSMRLSKTRVLTMGIGFYCNWFFLKMLAQIGHGFSDVVVYRERLFQQVMQLLNMAAIPVVTSVVLELPGVQRAELYPFPIPDLFMGSPLTVAGKYSGTFPDTVTIRGLFADNEVFEMRVQTRTSDVIPVSKVFLKERIDLLTARAWLEDSKDVEDEVVDLSCQHSLPSAYTTMVTMELTPEQKEEVRRLQGRSEAFADERELLLRDAGAAAGGRPGGWDDYDDDDDYDDGGSGGGGDGDGDDDDDDDKGDDESKGGVGGAAGGGRGKKMAGGKKQKWYRNRKKLAALAVGNAVVVGATAFSFGSVAGTIANVPGVPLLAGGIESACCGCCNCDNCDITDCLSC